MKKRIKLFGRSIPISLVLLILVVSVAAAVFGAMYLATVNITAGTGPEGVINMWHCSLQTGSTDGTVGTLDTCELVDHEINVVASGIDNDISIVTMFEYTPATTQIYTLNCPDPLPAGLSGCLATTLPSGSVLPAGVMVDFGVALHFADLVPGMVMEEFSYNFEFTNQ